MKSLQFSVLLFSFLFLGCGNPSDIHMQNTSVSGNSQTKKSDQVSEKTFKPFYIFSDRGMRENHYVPSGFMPNGKCVKLINSWNNNCFKGDTCIKIIYDVECSHNDQRWAGVYWLNPPNNWGSRKGGFNLTGATKLTFWARGDVGGEQIEEFKMGGIEGDYPDSDFAVIGPVILSPEWKQYSIDLSDKDLSYISGGFAWSANEEMNPESCTFYLDEIKFE